MSGWGTLIGAVDHEERLASDLEYFAAQRLKIRTKSEGLKFFVFNDAQRYVHEILEKQLRETGRVRAYILKARQQGLSTYTAGRFYRAVTKTPGLRCSIIAHETKASSNLYSMVKRFHENMPEGERLETGTANQDELVFSKIDSGYLVTVATEDGAGRSSTPQLVHGSEFAFWVRAEEQIASLLSAVPEGGGSEVILETTSDKFGSEAHQLWRKAESGQSEFIAIFLPWFFDQGYRRALPDDFELTTDEREYKALYKLDDEQVYWRRLKIALLGEKKFMREFPSNSTEPWIGAEHDSFIPNDLVIKARKCDDVEDLEYGPAILGVDLGRSRDKSVISLRRGRAVTDIWKYQIADLAHMQSLLAKKIDEIKPAVCYVDAGSFGIALCDNLKSRGYDEVVPVFFGGKSLETPQLDEHGNEFFKCRNRRAELWNNLKEALEGAFSLPDDDDMNAELISCGYKYDDKGQLLIEKKEDVIKRLKHSPDVADSIALTFGHAIGERAPQLGANNSNFNRELGTARAPY
jgi:hypothetical protein